MNEKIPHSMFKNQSIQCEFVTVLWNTFSNPSQNVTLVSEKRKIFKAHI